MKQGRNRVGAVPEKGWTRVGEELAQGRSRVGKGSEKGRSMGQIMKRETKNRWRVGSRAEDIMEWT